MPLIPIRLRQFPTFVRQIVEREQVLRCPARNTVKFHLCYFSCCSHFRFLYCSLHSLKQALAAVKYDVQIFADRDDPLTDAQIACLQSLLPGLRITPWPRGLGWGAEQIASIWTAYGRMAAESADDDFIVCVDSDVFFFNDRIFQAAARSGADLIGDGHYVNFRYPQGGCYFVRVSAVRRVGELLIQKSMEQIAGEADVVAEDVMANHLVRSAGLRVWLTWYMMFPDELRIAKRLSSWQQWKFSCLHFVGKDKVPMLQAYENHVLAGAIPEDYQLAMATGVRQEAVAR